MARRQPIATIVQKVKTQKCQVATAKPHYTTTPPRDRSTTTGARGSPTMSAEPRFGGGPHDGDRIGGKTSRGRGKAGSCRGPFGP